MCVRSRLRRGVQRPDRRNGPAAEAASYTARETRSATGMVVLPGLINLHAYLANSLQRGLYDELPFTEWYSGTM